MGNTPPQDTKQLIKETRELLPMKPGEIERYDFKYEREGMRNLFFVCEPLKGIRYFKVTERQTKRDWAEFIREIVDAHYQSAKKVVLIMDNLNSSLSQ